MTWSQLELKATKPPSVGRATSRGQPAGQQALLTQTSGIWAPGRVSVKVADLTFFVTVWLSDHLLCEFPRSGEGEPLAAQSLTGVSDFKIRTTSLSRKRRGWVGRLG